MGLRQGTILLILVVLFAFYAVVPSTTAQERSALEWYSDTQALHVAEDWKGLLDLSERWTKSEPNNADAWYCLGYAHIRLNRHQDATEAFRQAIRINPEYAMAWYNLGIGYGHLNRYDDAIDAYRQVIRINPEYAMAWYNLALVYALSGNSSAAVDALLELGRLDPAMADRLFDVLVPR